MASSSHHHRSSSPGRRAINSNTYGRYSDLDMTSGAASHIYLPSRSSGDRLAPPSASQTYVRDPRLSGYDRPAEIVYATHTRPRRSTFNEGAIPPPLLAPRSSTTTTGRPSSPLASSSRSPHEGHGKAVKKKTYVIGDNKTTLVDHVDLNSKSTRGRQPSIERGSDSTHRRRESVERVIYAVPATSKSYHQTGSQSNRDSVMSSYPDSGSKYHDHESSFHSSQPRARTRRSSLENRERPRSLIYDSPRYSARDLGPPSSKALDRFNENVTRSNSSRQSGTKVAYEDWDAHGDYVKASRRADTVPKLVVHEREHDHDHDHFKKPLASPQGRASDPYMTVHPATTRDTYDARSYDDRYSHDDRYGERREPRTSERSHGHRYQDASVERRGFGLLPAKNDRDDARSSAESFERRTVPNESREQRYDTHVERDDAKDERRRWEREQPRLGRNDYDTRDRDDHHGSDWERKQRDHDRSQEPKHRERERERDTRHSTRDGTRDDQDSHEDRHSGYLPAAVAGGVGAAAAYGLESKRRERYSDADASDGNGGDRHREQRASYGQEAVKEKREIDTRRSYPTHDVEKVDLHTERAAPPAQQQQQQGTSTKIDADEDYRRRLQQAQETLRPRVDTVDEGRPLQDPIGRSLPARASEVPSRRTEQSPDRDHNAQRRSSPKEADYGSYTRADDRTAPPISASSYSPQHRIGSSGSNDGLKESMDKKQVRIVEPAAESESKLKGILKKPKEQFPEHPNPIREGVAPLKDKISSEIPAGAKWTKVTRSQVNPQALEEAGERFEERDGYVIILRVVPRAEIDKLAEKTRQIRERGHRRRQEEYERESRNKSRREADEYSDESSDDGFSERKRPPRMLEAPMQTSPTSFSAPPTIPAVAGPPPGQARTVAPGAYPRASEDYVRDRERERREREWTERARERDQA